MNLINPTYDPAAGEKFDIDFLFVVIKNILLSVLPYILLIILLGYMYFVKGRAGWGVLHHESNDFNGKLQNGGMN